MEESGMQISEETTEVEVQQLTESSEAAAAAPAEEKVPQVTVSFEAEAKDQQLTGSSGAEVEVQQVTGSSGTEAEVQQLTGSSEAAAGVKVIQVTENSEAAAEVIDKQLTGSSKAAAEVKDKQLTESFEAAGEAKDKQLTESSKAAEVKVKQPTGSSKRKRKHSIKRNVVPDDNSDCSDVSKPPKIERTSGKRVKGEKKKAGKDVKTTDKTTPKTGGSEVSETSLGEEAKSESLNLNELLQGDDAEDKCKNLRSSEVANGECSPIKLQCQNCKFCSEYIENKEETDEAKEKLVKDKQKFTCEICAKGGSSRVYNSVERYKHHMAVSHEIYSDEIKRFECTECPETVWFPSKSKYTYHLGTKHPGIMRFVCEYCTEVFILKANYKNHMKTHNIVVQKKFTCDVCTGTFVNKAGFEAHKRRFPGPHIKQRCSHCGFSFSKEKHMKNHRCKTLLLEEAAARANQAQAQEVQNIPVTESSDVLKVPVVNIEVKNTAEENQILIDKKIIEATLEMDSSSKKSSEGSEQSSKRVVFHRIIPRRNQDQQVYRPVQTQGQGMSEPLVVQELREIDLENGTFIAATSNEPEQQYIVRDINGHFLQGNQILQLDINDVQPGEENQVYLADWNIVAPYVLREKSP